MMTVVLDSGPAGMVTSPLARGPSQGVQPIGMKWHSSVVFEELGVDVVGSHHGGSSDANQDVVHVI